MYLIAEEAWEIANPLVTALPGAEGRFFSCVEVELNAPLWHLDILVTATRDVFCQKFTCFFLTYPSEKDGNISDMPLLKQSPDKQFPALRRAGVDTSVRQLIQHSDPGKVFTSADFLHLGSRAAVDQALSRLARQGVLRRLRRGLYDKPREHKIFGELLPETARIADALAEKSQLRIQPSGAYAANLLGLSEQVPLKLTFLTDGPTRTVTVGKQTVMLKHTTPKNMATAGRISGLVIQALRYMKQTQMDITAIGKLRHALSESDKFILRQDAHLAPAWIGKIMRQLGDGELNE